jgi:potassium-transporting ATPase ATP-binding subunit
VDAISRFLEQSSLLPKKVRDSVEEIARVGETPVVVVENSTALGVIHLKDDQKRKK